MVLYRIDDPTEALRRVVDRVTSVHVKDGLPPADPQSLGLEVPPGTGRARVKKCLRILHEAQFEGPLIIENYTWRAGGDPHSMGLQDADAAAWSADPLEALRYAKSFIERSLVEIDAA
jgi:sugar phosphate isomerase/epimerase